MPIVTTDFFGTPRPQGAAYDIGAHEYTGGVTNTLTSSFTASVLSGTAPLTVNFASTSVSSGTITSYAWTFGDGGTGNTSSLSHVFSAPGTFTVTLTVMDSNGLTSSSTKTITVTAAAGSVVAAYTYTPSSGVAPVTVAFTNASTGATSYLWDFGDGTTSTATNPSHTFSTAGTYSVILQATGASGSNSVTQVVTALASTGATGCTNNVLTNGNFATNNLNGWTTFTNGTVAFSGATGKAVVTVTSGGTNSQLMQKPLTLVNGQNYKLQFTASATSPVQLLLRLLKDTSPFTNYMPSTGVQLTTTPTVYTVTWTQSGTVSDGRLAFAFDGITSNTITIDDVCVGDAPLGTIIASFTPAGGTGAAPYTVNFVNTSTATNGIVTWAWDFGDGGTSSLPNPTHTFGEPGTYMVSLLVTGPDGTDPQVYAFVVPGVITASFSVQPGSTTNCRTYYFGDTSTATDGITSWAWDFGDGTTSTMQSPQKTFAADGTYAVTLTVSGPNGTDTATEDVVVVCDSTVTSMPATAGQYIMNGAGTVTLGSNHPSWVDLFPAYGGNLMGTTLVSYNVFSGLGQGFYAGSELVMTFNIDSGKYTITDETGVIYGSGQDNRLKEYGLRHPGARGQATWDSWQATQASIHTSHTIKPWPTLLQNQYSAALSLV